MSLRLASFALGCAASVAAGALPARADERRLNFENDIVPILSRYGCNASGCHGKAEGQNGFKLSVFGFDPRADHRALTVEGRGRRVFPAAPEKSLLLLKASGGMPHGGGVRIPPERPEYATLQRWIAQGMPFGSADDPTIVKIELSTRETTLAMGQSLPLAVTATWSNGRIEDVTSLARFQSNNDGRAAVDEAGLVTAGQSPGVAAVMASYLGQVDALHVVVPRSEPVDPYPMVEEFNFIDGHVYRRLKQLQIVPAEVCSDAEFLRRVYLDLIGTLPTSDEARAFLADGRTNRRALLVEQLLQRPEFADYWALKWADLLRVDRQALGHKGAYDFYRWIHESLATAKPLDVMAREIVTAEGPLAETPPANFYSAVREPGKAASTVSQVFLGVRIECAQCHHHPFDRWSQEDYFGMTAYFAQLQRKSTPLGEILLAEGDPATTHPRTGQAIPAHALAQPMREKNPAGDRRQELAAWLTAPENPWFARNIANRVWAHLLGRGLVEPVDDFRATNPPSNPELLNALAAHLASQRFDLRSLLRAVCASRTYQHASHTNETNAKDEQNYSRALYKRMDAEVLLDALCQTTGVPDQFDGAPAGTRAIELWDSQVEHYFLRLFGRPVRQTACECERVVEPSVAQVLHLLNSERVDGKLRHEAGRVAELAQSETSDQRLVEELYLTALSRYPSDAERNTGVEYLAAAALGDVSQRRARAEDLLWTLLNSLEFVFNH
ncbi:MAG TPA: DUF1549 and DUF1553 domain-containing protein [Pirellulaceae bacterium]|nr:DUF1549 and DUF1553 domain-containing protein [Pirellulaceae bacterium]